MKPRPADNRFEAVVVSADPDASFVELDAGGTRLAARLWPGVKSGQVVTVRVRPEDVVLCTERPGLISTRNVLPGRVVQLRHRPEGVAVGLDVGVPLHALVTRRTVDELDIVPGRELLALVKATAVVPVVAVGTSGEFISVEVSVVGPHGTLEARKLALLRDIHATGSLTAAARESGVTYRTAWLWVLAMNEAWGTPLVVTVKGGAGGGGAQLTAEAHGVLDLAERCQRRVPRDSR
jgi:molybdate transport repressor ModE-like protein/molybdopterin-binding protein